jgi:hypothetical protein
MEELTDQFEAMEFRESYSNGMGQNVKEWKWLEEMNEEF